MEDADGTIKLFVPCEYDSMIKVEGSRIVVREIKNKGGEQV